ncbi:MAG: YciI family protein [Chloroflexota bacterium]
MSEQNLYVYHLKLAPKYTDPANWTDADHQIIGQHAQFFIDLGKQGVLLFAGRTDLPPGDANLFGIAVFKADSLESAKAIMANDPARRHGIQVGEILPFRLPIHFIENFG